MWLRCYSATAGLVLRERLPVPQPDHTPVHAAGTRRTASQAMAMAWLSSRKHALNPRCSPGGSDVSHPDPVLRIVCFSTSTRVPSMRNWLVTRWCESISSLYSCCIALPRYTDTVKEFGERECTTVGVHSYRSYRFQERIAYCRLERMKEYACEGCASEGRRQDMVSLRHPRRLFNILA